ncbi:placenta-specific protein 1-like [Antechinus flavipes]|uniref:placenta-specific protein 1-like n=1 Tax=Antechinus flavipes TaxID=38775 RepID=UPI00223696BC|nr:placenta-specific protein 1-like [Antechinus flavipes]
MKAFLALGILCLLFCLVWVQEKSVITACSQYVLWVFVKKDLFGDGTFVESHELHLGFGCPVTRVLEDQYELQYLVVHCGIRKMVYETYTRYDCTLFYNPWNTNGPRPSLAFSLTCILPRKRRIRNVHVSPPKSTPMPNQKNSPQKTEHNVSRPTHWDSVSCHLLGRNLLELLKIAQEMRDLLLTPHLISVVCWKQDQQPCLGICCHKDPSGIRSLKNFNLSDLDQRRIRVPCSLDLDDFTPFLPPVID